MSLDQGSFPFTRQDDTVDELHGVSVPDPYRWLEDSADPEVMNWTHAQNERSERFLQSLPGRTHVEERLTDLLQVSEAARGDLAGDNVFTERRERGREQPVLYVRDGINGTDRVLFDPSLEDESGLLSLDWWYPSGDGALLAYGVSIGGDEWSELRIRDVESNVDLADRIPRARFASIAWMPDASGFFYTRYPKPGEVSADEENYWRRVYFHVIGTPYQDDPLVWGDNRPMTDMPAVNLDDTGRWLIVDVDEGWSKTDIFIMDRQNPDAGFRDITPAGESTHTIVGIVDDILYTRTYAGAPNGHLLARTLTVDAASWIPVIPEKPERILDEVVITASGFATTELEDAVAVIRRYDRSGVLDETVVTPEIGSAPWLAGSHSSETALVGFTSFLRPTTAMVLQPAEPARELVSLDRPIGFNPDDYTVSQEWFSSRDGTSVPMFIVHRRDLALDGSNPTVLNGYGGFRAILGSDYDPAVPLWLAHGGVYAVANLRGGGEFGMDWHHAGMLDRKQNVFDDFIAAAEHLVAAGYTSSEHLGIRGRSNGGLLVGATMTQRPDLCRAVHCGVPLLDMLRYHHFQIARIWIPEYGSADDPDQFPYLHAYSPYHAVRDGVEYPATLVTCAVNDSRVDPLHARKMVARLQAATIGGADRPILLRSDEDAGHGAGKPLHMRVREAADMWTFFGWQLGMEWQK